MEDVNEKDLDELALQLAGPSFGDQEFKRLSDEGYKTRNELVRKVGGLVKRVKGKNYFYKQGNGIIGPGYHETTTGEESELTIILDGADDDSDSRKQLPVKTITFSGYSPVRPGDEVIAYICAGDEIDMSHVDYWDRERIHPRLYAPRELKEKEDALAIKILGPCEDEYRADIANNASDFDID